MMKVKEMTTLRTIIDNIGTLSDETEETKSTLETYINTKFGERTVIDSFVSEPVVAGNIIDMLYASKWKRIKEGITTDIPLTTHETHEKEEKTSDVFGYDGTGTTDTKITTEHTSENEIDDVFGNLNKSFDFYTNFKYYDVVARDVVHEITTYIFE